MFKKLSIIMPCYNEKNTVIQALNKVLEVDLGEIAKEIILVDDGSTDGTRKLLADIKDPQVVVILQPRNLGKGLAIRTALKAVSGDLVIIQDADLEYNPQDYRKLIEVMIKKDAQVVYGSRNLNKNNKWSYAVFAWGGVFLSLLTNLLYGSKITDEPTCYKLLRTKLLKSLNLKAKGFEFCPEVTAKILKLGHRIYEVPISYSARHLAEGKKINWKDGLIAIWTLLKYKWIS